MFLVQLHEYIKKVHDILRLLEERRNTASPINRLPTETLTSIFDGLQDYHKFHDIFPAVSQAELATSHSWIVVTCICQHWHTIALSTPMLWKNLYTRTIRAWLWYGG